MHVVPMHVNHQRTRLHTEIKLCSSQIDSHLHLLENTFNVASKIIRHLLAEQQTIHQFFPKEEVMRKSGSTAPRLGNYRLWRGALIFLSIYSRAWKGTRAADMRQVWRATVCPSSGSWLVLGQTTRAPWKGCIRPHAEAGLIMQISSLRE